MDYKIHDCVETTSNIAILKYWGKRNIELNLPANSSISLTLDRQFSTKTVCITVENYDSVDLYLNGYPEKLSPRHRKILEKMEQISISRKLKPFRGLIYSINSFPTSCGLASSASGAAALVLALNSCLGSQLSFPELCDLTRQCSGSGVRSLIPGWSLWNRGTCNVSSVEKIESSIDPDVIVFILESGQKKVPSSEGMERSATTSPLYMDRIEKIVPENQRLFIEQLSNNDWDGLCDTIISDCESFIDVCNTTSPPLKYQNDLALRLIPFVKKINSETSEKIAITFDAGSNPFIFCKKGSGNEIINLLEERLPELRTCQRYVLGRGDGPVVSAIDDPFKHELEEFLLKTL